MRKCSIKFQSKRSGGRNALSPIFKAADGTEVPRFRRDVVALTHHVVSDKESQLSVSYGMMNLLRRFGGFWLPRNQRTRIAQYIGSVAAVAKQEADGVCGDRGLINSPRVRTQYYMEGIHA